MAKYTGCGVGVTIAWWSLSAPLRRPGGAQLASGCNVDIAGTVVHWIHNGGVVGGSSPHPTVGSVVAFE
jgi:hypothetical protein